MSEENGIELPKAELPELTLTFNPEAQGLTISFDDKKVKTWEMVIMMLTAALQQAEFNRNMAQGQAMQRAQIEAMQNQALKQQIATRGNLMR